MSESRAGREKASKTMQHAKKEKKKKGKFIADSSQGSCRDQRSGAGSESPEPKLLHKFIRWAQAVGSWLKRIGYMFAKQSYWPEPSRAFFKLGHSGLFSFPLIGALFLTRRMLVGWLRPDNHVTPEDQAYSWSRLPVMALALAALP